MEQLPRRVELRVWPGVVLVAIQWVARYLVPMIAPEATMFGFLAAMVCSVGIVIWWLGFSRATWPERLGALALMAVLLFATRQVVHPSIAGGMMGLMLPVFALPVLCLALVVAVAVARRWPSGRRRVLIGGAIVVGCAVFALLRTDGITSVASSDFHWRWTPTAEEQLLARATPAPPPAQHVTPPPGTREVSWPGFRGPQRDGVVRGVKIDPDWAKSPPVELWRRPIGPGWASFAVAGPYIYTQEQRGDDELVTCYSLAQGELVWTHADRARFWESNAGPGPRGTPTLHESEVYTIGATGIVNALDRRDGKVRWTRNAVSDTKVKIPDWGIASSPLVWGDLVVVATSGTLAAYDRQSGELRWMGPKHGHSYCSPQWLTLDGVGQVALISNWGLTSVAPADGKVLWEHAWKGFGVTQPVLLPVGAGPTTGADVLMSTADRSGIRRIEIKNTGGAWSTTERWTSTRLKPYFNDFAVHGSHVYGFDGGALGCVALGGGERTWKGGKYGSGQLLLLADQDLLLVISEQGELALVNAVPGAFTEAARFKALEGKTWNHPVLAGDTLLVRNDREMAAFRLKLAAR